MISANPAVVVAMLALAGVAVAQEHTDEQRIADLIASFSASEPEHRDDVLQELADVALFLSDRL